MTELLTPVLEGGLRFVNFFNGRLLSGEDLSQEKTANRDARRRIGRVVGDGVAFGFEVSESTGVSTVPQPVLTVTPGLAVNRKGQTLMLTTKTDVSLVRSLDSTLPGDTTFDVCKPANPSVYVAGEGVYLLVVCPASGKDGRAPVSGLGSISASCNTRYTVECVQFRLIQLGVSDVDMGDLPRLRNRLAYKCFGVTEPDYTDFLSDPLGLHAVGYGLLDKLRPRVLTDCDIPLALMLWTSTGGLNFIDMWSVQRRITPPDPDGDWLELAGPRRHTEGESMFLQFQQHITDIRLNELNLSAIRVTDRFDFLPPVGVVPITGTGTPLGFDYLQFFQNLTLRGPVFMEGAKVGSLLRSTLAFPPIDLHSGEMIWLYRVRENMEAVADTSSHPPQPFMIFSRGNIPYQANAQFDLSRWDYSNIALNAG